MYVVVVYDKIIQQIYPAYSAPAAQYNLLQLNFTDARVSIYNSRRDMW